MPAEPGDAVTPPPTRRRTGEFLFDLAWFLTFALASSAYCLETAASIGLTFDEWIYLEKGLQRLRTGSADPLVRMGTMPLPVDVQYGPLRLYEKWRGTPIDPAAEAGEVIVIARAMNLTFWWLLLIYARLVGRSIGGAWAGRAAVALLACEPSMLAHASLATTDLSVTACLLAMGHHARQGRGSPSWKRRVLLPGLWAGAALLAKASSLVFGPILYAAIELEHRLREGFGPMPAGVGSKLRVLWSAVHPFRRDWICAGLIAMTVATLYIGSDFQPQASFVKWADSLEPGAGGDAMRGIAHNLRIFPNVLNALSYQVTHNVRGHGAYLLGVVHERAIWWYFPVLTTIKLSVGLLAVIVIALAARNRAWATWPLIGAAILLLLSPAFRVQIGIRMVLPMVSLAAIGSAAAVAVSRRRASGFLLAACCAWSAFDSLRVFPNALCYVNSLWGGTEDGYRLVSDSNYDWGQGAAELDAWQRRAGVERMAVWYFGTDPAIRRGGRRVVPVHTMPVRRLDELRAVVPEGLLAVSTTLLHGPYASDKSELLAELRAREPVRRTTTFLIYDLRSPGP